VIASSPSGQAPFAVTLTASGDAASYTWDLGDGSSAVGSTVAHDYATGLFTATVTAAAADGETSRAQIAIRAESIALAAPTAVTYGRTVEFNGSVQPAAAGIPVTLSTRAGVVGRGKTGRNGGFRIRVKAGAPGPVVASADKASSEPFTLVVRPSVTVAFRGDRALYGKLRAVARVRPAWAGTLAVTLRRAGEAAKTISGRRLVTVPVDTTRPGRILVSALVRVAPGWATTAATATALRIAYPRLAVGANGAAITELRRRLGALGYAVPSGSSSFDSSLLDSVYAFAKVQGLPRTGIVDGAFWARLDHPVRPRPRYAAPADHLEVNKPQQVLYVVRGGRVATIIPVSTAGLPGRFTPVGRFSIYRKVTGFDPSPLGTLYDPMYFTGGYAIHGNPSVPPYPASHGCVRVPMWIAPTLYATNAYGAAVYVY
jgi:L,D-transpeptidase-like protein/PKD domain-containing protein/putative peptidoglycan binding protein